MNQSQIQEQLTKTLKKDFPKESNEFDIILKPKGGADMQTSQHVQNLVNAIYYVYFQSAHDSCTKLYTLVRQFAKAFKEEEFIKELDELWGKPKKVGKDPLFIPTIEVVIMRAMSSPDFKLSKTHNFGSGQIFTLGELNLRIQFVKRRIFDFFTEIYLKNDVKMTFNWPVYDMKSEGSVMQPL